MEVDDVDESCLIPSLVFTNEEALEAVEDVFPADSLFTVYTEESIRSPGDQDNTIAQIKEEENVHHEEVSPVEEVEVPDEDDEIRVRFILNLYGPEEGYSYGMLDPQIGETPESHLLPYSEKYIIDCIDNGVIPWKVVALLKDSVGWDLISCAGTVLAEIRDYRHFSTVMPNTAKIRHVLLRPTNESLLSDLDHIVEEGYREKIVFEQEKESAKEMDELSELITIDSVIEDNCGSPSLSSASNGSKCSLLPSTSSSSPVGDEEETFCIDIKEEPIVDDEDGSSADDENSFVDDPEQDATADDVSEDDEQEVEEAISPPEPVVIKEEPVNEPVSMNHLVSPIKIEQISSPPQQFTISVKQEAPSTAHLEYSSTIFDGEMSSARSNSYNKSDVDCDYSSKHFLPVNCRIVKQGVIDSSSINDKDIITNLSAQNLSEPYGNGMCKIYVCSPCNSNEKETDLSRYSGSENQNYNGKAVIIPEENSNNYIGCYTMKIDEYEENCDSGFTQMLNDMEMNEASKCNNIGEEVVKNCIDVQSNVELPCNFKENGFNGSGSNGKEFQGFSHSEIKTECEPMEINGEHSYPETFGDILVSETMMNTVESEENEDCQDFQPPIANVDEEIENCESYMDESENFSQNEAKTDYNSNSEDEFDNESDSEEDDDEDLNFRFFRTKCDHKYDRQHYKGIRNGSSSDSESESDTSSESGSGESFSESDSVSVSSSVSDDSCKLSEMDENHVRTEWEIVNEGEDEISDNESKSNSDSSDSESTSEPEYFDETKHRWLPEPKVIEDEQFIITDVDPFAPERICPQKEYFEEQAPSCQSQFISTEDFEDSEVVGYAPPDDHYPSAEIETEGPIRDEMHPKGLVKAHQLALFGRELNDEENQLLDSDDSDDIELEEDLEEEQEENEGESGESIFAKCHDEEDEDFLKILANEEELKKNLELISIENSDYVENNVVLYDPNIVEQYEHEEDESDEESDEDSESVGYCVNELPSEVNEEEVLILDEDRESSSNSELNNQYFSEEDAENEEEESILVMVEDEDGHVYTDNLKSFDEEEQEAILNSLKDCYLMDDEEDSEESEESQESLQDSDESDNEEHQYYDNEDNFIDTEKEVQQESFNVDEEQIFSQSDANNQNNSENFQDISMVVANRDVLEDLMQRLMEIPEEQISNSEMERVLENEDLDTQENETVVETVQGILDGTHFDTFAEHIKFELDQLETSEVHDMEEELEPSDENIINENQEFENDEENETTEGMAVQEYQNFENDEEYENVEEQQRYENVEEYQHFQTVGEQGQHENVEGQPQFVNVEGQSQYENVEGQPQYENVEGQPQYENVEGQPQYENVEGHQQFENGEEQPQFENAQQSQYENVEQPQYENVEELEQYENVEENQDFENIEDDQLVENMEIQQMESMEEDEECEFMDEEMRRALEYAARQEMHEKISKRIARDPVKEALFILNCTEDDMYNYSEKENEEMESENENAEEDEIERNMALTEKILAEEYSSDEDEEEEDDGSDAKNDFVNQFYSECNEELENSDESGEDDNEDMAPEQIDKILESEECEDVLREITSDILLEAATDDYLVKGLKLSFVQEMNEFVQSAYDKYSENPLASKYANMSREELEREIELEIATDEFCKEDSDYDPNNLDALDARLYKCYGENKDYFKELDQQLLSGEELKEFMQFKFSLDDFCPDEEDNYLAQLYNVEDIEESKSSIHKKYYPYDFMDEHYFVGEAVLSYLEEQLEECIETDRNPIEEDEDDSVEEEEEIEVDDLIEEMEDSVEVETIENDAELSYDQRLKLEESLVNTTSEKLCLDPSPYVTLLSNRLQFEKLKWNAPEIKNSMRNWAAPEPPVENLFHKLYKENPNDEHVKTHLKRKRSALLRKPKPIENAQNRIAKGIKRPRALLEPRELTLSKLLRSDMDEDISSTPPVPEEEDSFYDSPESFHSFFQFILDVKAKKAASRRSSDKDERQISYEEKIADPETRKKMLTLEPPQIIDFMDVEPPSNYDVLKKVFKTPEPAMIQSFPIENTCRVIEEYLLETDRRKKPHYTKVTIYQRNYLENYHGEVLMESLFEPTAPSPLGKFPKIPPYTTCEFGLGCSGDVALYIKQFLDIFSEDGKRACKVTCHKVGQPFPFVVATPYYKPIFPEPPIPKEFQFTIGPSTVNPYPTYMERNMKFPTQGFTQNLTHLYYPSGPNHGQHNHYVNQLLLNQNNNYSQSNSNSYGFLGHSLYNTSSNASTSSSSASSSTSTSQPPVQIVHPQPRPVQQQQQSQQIVTSSAAAAAASISSGQIYAASSTNPVLTQSIQQPASANVNFNVNVNSSGIVGISPQQVLTRPHILNVNVQQQPQQQTIQTRAVNVPTQQQLQQLAQQRNLRMRQQQLQKQQQYIQQHPTALAKLLTSNIQGHVGANKPITVAVPPQPQNPNKNANPPQSPSENLTMSIGSPIEHHAIQHHPPTVSPSPNVNVNVNTAPNVNVNLNTISLDGLLSGTPSGINYSTSTSNIVTSNVSVVGNNRIVSGTSISPATALNILRLNAGGGTTGNVNLINTNNLSRGLTVSNLNSNNVSIMSQPQQRILVNSAGNVVATQNQQQLGDLEEISVTDLNSFLNSQQIQICQLGVGQQVALSQNHPQIQQQLQLQQATIPQQHIQTLDSHNVNLNLNVNLNSGSSESTQQIAKIQGGDWTTTTNSNAPFVVFISPLTRPLNSDNSGQASRAAGSSSTVNVNLAAIQTTPPHSSQQSQTIVLETSPSANKTQNHQQFDAQNLISSDQIVGVTPEGVAVDTLFNALSDAIGPELGKKLDVIGSIGHNTVVVSSTVNVPISSPVIQSRISPQSHLPTYNLINMQSTAASSTHGAKFTSHVAPSQQNANVITLNDLLASPTIVSSSTGGNYSGSASFVLSSNNNSGNSTNNSNTGALLSPISKPSASPGPSITSSHVASSTPRLSALLAGSPSADSMLSAANNTLSILSDSSSHGQIGSGASNSLLANAIDASTHSTASYGNLLDRLAASLSQPPGTASQIRTGVSRLNPIASATPNVVLEHPMLAASLTQQSTSQPTNRATAYRQIAPAPPPNLVQHAHAQPQQLINLLGLNPTGQTRTIRISATTPVTGKPSPSSGNMGAGR